MQAAIVGYFVARITINDKAVRDAIKKIDNTKWMREPMKEATEYIYEVTQNQPKKKPGAFSRLATPGQRRAYWAKVRSGEAQHGPGGYIRSGNLKRSWKRLVRSTQRGLRGIVESGISYGRFVQGRNIQPFHKVSGWLTDRQIAKRNQDQVNWFFRKALNKVVK